MGKIHDTFPKNVFKFLSGPFTYLNETLLCMVYIMKVIRRYSLSCIRATSAQP